jgi:hypothetical protein
MLTTIALALLLAQEPVQKTPIPTPRIIIKDEIKTIFYVDAVTPSGMRFRVPVLNGLLPRIDLTYIKGQATMDLCEFVYSKGTPFQYRNTKIVKYDGSKAVKVAEGDDEVYLLNPLPPTPDELLKKPSEVEKE